MSLENNLVKTEKEQKQAIFEKKMDLINLINIKLNEQGESLQKMSDILDEIGDIGTNIGKENARVMFDIKYKEELLELTKQEKKTIEEIKVLEEKLRVIEENEHLGT